MNELAQRQRAVRRVLWLILGANWLVAGLKLAYGLIADSASMTADGLHSFIDGASNIIGLVALKFAAQPADDGHPYGHQKFETLASLAIGVMIGVGVLELGRMAFDALLHGQHPTVGIESFAVMIGTLLVNVGVTRYEAVQGRKLKSALLTADASHTMSDVWVTLAVLASLALSKFGWGRADGFVALGVLVLVAHTGWQIIRQAVGILADSVRVDPDRVREVLATIPGVIGSRAIRSRGLEGHVAMDLVIFVEPALELLRAHHIADDVEQRLTSAFPEVQEVLVHVEPAR
ncbi:MAG: cation diffusion facilitator family transporter [Archangium sp.]